MTSTSSFKYEYRKECNENIFFFGRVFGAVVICAGLYLVIWGKGKDYKHSSTPKIDDISSELKIEQGEIGKDIVDHELITISKQGEQRRTIVETVLT